MYFPQYSYATMRVFVTRNVYPVIINLPQVIQVDETSLINSQVFVVQATDSDLLAGVSSITPENYTRNYTV